MGLMALICVAGFTACGDDDDNPVIPPTPSKKLTSLSITPTVYVSADLLDYGQVQVTDSLTGKTTTITKDMCTEKADASTTHKIYQYQLPTQTHTSFPVARHSYKVSVTSKGELPANVNNVYGYLLVQLPFTANDGVNVNNHRGYQSFGSNIERGNWTKTLSETLSNIWVYYSYENELLSTVCRIMKKTVPSSFTSLTVNPGICLSKDVLTYSDVQVTDSLTGKTYDITLDKCKAVSTASNERTQKSMAAYLTAAGEKEVYLYELPAKTYTAIPVARQVYGLKFTRKELPASVDKVHLYICADLGYTTDGTVDASKVRLYNQGKDTVLKDNWAYSFDKCTKNLVLWYACDTHGLTGRFTQL